MTTLVYAAISKVMGKLATEGIAKDRKNESQGYKFRGIDDVYNALAPHLSEAKLLILPSVKTREVIERRSRTDAALFYVTVCVEFCFVSAEDGSHHSVTTYGEAMDSGDKATNKAMSAAFKYACMQAFCIPTEGDNDADAQTHVVVAKDDPLAHVPQTAPGTHYHDPKIVERIKGAKTTEALRSVWSLMSPAERKTHHEQMNARHIELTPSDAPAQP